MSEPRIETGRLILRRPGPHDAEGYVEFFLTDRARHVGGRTIRHDAWNRFCAELGHWEIRGWGLFAVESKATGECLGLIGPYRPEGWPENEMGWILWSGSEGKGIAFEAAVATRHYARETLGWSRPVSYIHRENARSIALAERLGAVRDADARSPEHVKPGTCLVYRHPAAGAAA